MSSRRGLAFPAIAALAAASCILDTTGGKPFKGDDGSGGDGGAAGSGLGAGGNPSGGNGGGTAGEGGDAGSGGSSAICGDGIVDAGEQCDDSGTVDGDGCSALCTYDASDACGPDTSIALVNGEHVVLTGDTSAAANDLDLNCDGDQTPQGDVFFAITPAVDGDLLAVVSAGFDKSVYLLSGCTAVSPIDCDNDFNSNAGFIEAVTGSTTYYIGVDSRTAAGPFTLTLDLAVCGDGTLVPLVEECDDGNPTAGDGCSDLCVVECDPDLTAEETLLRGDNHCYKLYTTVPDDQKSWDEARAACQALGTGWDLASYGSTNENTFLDTTFGGPPDGLPTWIGGSDTATDGTFVWSNGDPWTYQPWGGGSPNTMPGNLDDCVAIVGVGGGTDLFDDLPCATTAPYVCERPPAGL